MNTRHIARGIARKTARNGGFTLVELLIAIGLIAVLSALVYTGAQTAMERSRFAQLISNLRTVGAATLQYASDSGNRLPASTGGDVYSSWQAAVAPYVGERTLNSGRGLSNEPGEIRRSVFRDPLDRSMGTYGGAQVTRHIRNIAINGMSSFGSQATGYQPPAPWGASYRFLSTIEYPSKLMLLTTGQHSSVGEEFAGGGMRVRSTFYSKGNPETYTRVPGMFYCLFVDGHLEVLDRETIVREATNDDQLQTSLLFDKQANNAAGK